MDQNNNREFLLEQLRQFLQNYKLSQYYDTFVAEGFDRLLSLFDITESDLVSLNVKRGHRRVLQRAIATARGVPLTTPIMINYGYEDQSNYGNGIQQPIDLYSDRIAKSGTTITTTTTTVTKTIENPRESSPKRYNQRKRKQFVPAKPVTAFDEFLKQVKNELSGDEHIELSDAILIAQERWNRLSVHQKERYEREALHANSDYVMDFNYDDQKSFNNRHSRENSSYHSSRYHPYRQDTPDLECYSSFPRSASTRQPSLSTVIHPRNTVSESLSLSD